MIVGERLDLSHHVVLGPNPWLHIGSKEARSHGPGCVHALLMPPPTMSYHDATLGSCQRLHGMAADSARGGECLGNVPSPNKVGPPLSTRNSSRHHSTFALMGATCHGTCISW